MPHNNIGSGGLAESDEVKSLTLKNIALAKEVADLKAKMLQPVRKSMAIPAEKSVNFEEKSRNPLDLIA